MTVSTLAVSTAASGVRPYCSDSGSGSASSTPSNIPQSAMTAVVVGTPSDSIGLPTCSSNCCNALANRRPFRDNTKSADEGGLMLMLRAPVEEEEEEEGCTFRVVQGR